MPDNNDIEFRTGSGGNVEGDSRAQIKRSLDKIKNQAIEAQIFIDYYDGKHPFNFSSEKFKNQFARRLQKFRDNLCPTCVKAPADRLEVIGFSSQKDSDIYKKSWELWKLSLMPKISRDVHRDAFKTGDGYAIVWLDDEGKARIWRQDPRNCCVFYNPETGKVETGAKVWRGKDDFIYLTLYFTDRIEKYISRSKQAAGNMPTTAAAFVKREVEGEVWPVPVDGDVCPLFHFGLEGSILNDVIPINDALNKTVADLLVSSEANSLRQRWTAGLTYEVDPETGKQIIPWDPNAQFIGSQDAAAKFGQFPDTVLQDFILTINDFRAEVANIAGIPQYYFRLEGGTIPSGEALRKAESRFTSLIKDAQLDFGETWAAVVRFALTLEGSNVPAPGDAATLETQWRPADPISDNELADLTQKKKAIGISTPRALSELGYSDADIKTMADENATAAADAADNFSKTFNAGPTVN